MLTENTGLLTRNSAAGVTATTAAIALPRNTLITAWVVTHNTTPANLCIPAIAGFDQVGASILTSNTTRLTLLRRMEVNDVGAATYTITGNGLAQTSFTWEIWWNGGVSTDGVNGAGAIGQVITDTSAGVSVTSLTLPFGSPFSSPFNGGMAAFQNSTAAAMGVGGSWTELSDFGWVGGEFQIQFIASNATDVTSTGSSGRMMGIAIELVAPSDAIIVTQPVNGSLIFNYLNVIPVPPPPTTCEAFLLIHMRPGKVYYLFLCQSNASLYDYLGVTTVGHPGDIVWATEAHFGFDTVATPTKRVFVVSASVAAEGDYSIRIEASGLPAVSIYVLAEVEILAQIQVAQRQSDVATANPTITMAAFARRNNGTLVFWMANAAISVETGWQSPIGTPASPGGGWLYNLFWRANADDAPGIGLAGVLSGGVALELQGAPPVGGNSPVITLVSPL